MSLQQKLHPENTSRVADVAGTVAGAAAGALAAPSLASAAGVTVIPVITAIGKLIGLSLLSATPVVWLFRHHRIINPKSAPAPVTD